TGFIYDGNAFYPYVPGGAWALSYDNITQDFVVGEIITGGTSGAVGTVYEILPGGGLVLTGDASGFEDNEALTGDMGVSAQYAITSSKVVTSILFPDGLSTAVMSYVWVFKKRLWFAQRESLTSWNMKHPDAIAGEVEK